MGNDKNDNFVMSGSDNPKEHPWLGPAISYILPKFTVYILGATLDITTKYIVNKLIPVTGYRSDWRVPCRRPYWHGTSSTDSFSAPV